MFFHNKGLAHFAYVGILFLGVVPESIEFGFHKDWHCYNIVLWTEEQAGPLRNPQLALCWCQQITWDVFVPYIEAYIPRGCAILVNAMSKNVFSMKQFLSNGRIWKNTADTELLPCICKAIATLLGLKSSGAVHCCVRLKDTLFGQNFQANSSADTIILRSNGAFMKSFVNAANHVFELMPRIDYGKL